MRTVFISSDDLHPLTTSPQCIDNQFVPGKLFKSLTAERKTKSLKQVIDRILEEHGGDPYLGPADKDANLLLSTQRNEYNRSLIYAKQVVVNRAAFWSSAPLVVSELSEDVEALAQLIQKSVIVPYLYDEAGLDNPPSNFDLLGAEKAMNRLITALGQSDIRCARLSLNHEDNEAQTDSLATRFVNEFVKLSDYGGDRRIARIVEMLLPENVSQADMEELGKRVHSVSKKVDDLKKAQFVGRQHIYQEFIAEPGTLVSHGIYRADRFTFEIKKWVDAIYTSNLPDALGILTFVPEGFPTAYDLGMSWSLGKRRKKQFTGTELIDEVVDRARNEVTWKRWNAFQKTAKLVLPYPDRLTHKDILEIRDLNAWSQMMDTLEDFLDPVAPGKGSGRSKESGRSEFDYEYLTKEMWEAFDHFNGALSAWYSEKTEAARSEDAEKFAVGIGRIYQWGEWMVGLLFGPDGSVAPILPALGVRPPDLSSHELKFAIQVGLFFINEKGINWRRSQLVQKMENQLVVSTDDVRTMIEGIITLFPESAPYLKPTLSAEMEG